MTLGAELSASVAKLRAQFANDQAKAKSNEQSGSTRSGRPGRRSPAKSGVMRERARDGSVRGNELSTIGGLMKSGMRDQVEGKAKQVKGAVKQKMAKATGNPQ